MQGHWQYLDTLTKDVGFLLYHFESIRLIGTIAIAITKKNPVKTGS